MRNMNKYDIERVVIYRATQVTFKLRLEKKNRTEKNYYISGKGTFLPQKKLNNTF